MYFTKDKKTIEEIYEMTKANPYIYRSHMTHLKPLKKVSKTSSKNRETKLQQRLRLKRIEL